MAMPFGVGACSSPPCDHGHGSPGSIHAPGEAAAFTTRFRFGFVR